MTKNVNEAALTYRIEWHDSPRALLRDRFELAEHSPAQLES
jgi:hypothetical protein